MIYLLSLIMLFTGYYSLTYGLSLVMEDKNLLGGCAVVALTVIGTIVPIIVLIQKNR